MNIIVILVYCMIASAINSQFISDEWRYVYGYLAGTIGFIVADIGK